MTGGSNTATLIDYSESIKYEVQPFFKAGDYKTIKWIHRKSGHQYSGAAFLEQKDYGVEEDNTHVILGATTSGIAGSTFYQIQAQLMAFS